MQDFRQLKVWQKAHELTLEIYRVTHGFPKEELFSLTQEMRRSAMSIPTNIAEGSGRSSDADFCRFLWISSGSAKELEYQTILAKDLKYLDEISFRKLSSALDEVKRMLTGLIQSVNRSQ